MLAAQLIADLNPHNFGSSPQGYTALGSTALFWANNQLYASNGTAAATTALPGPTTSGPLVVMGGNAYFVRIVSGGANELWKSDGTIAGTGKVTVLPQNAGGLWTANNRLYFAAGGTLWTNDGTAAAPIQLGTFDSTVIAGVAFNGGTYFLAQGTGGTGLWKTDNTAAGTNLVKATDTDRIAGLGSGLSVINGKMYFSGVSYAAGLEPWVSDGTTAGTAMLANLSSGSSSSFPKQFTALGTTALFIANGYLYKVNGATAILVTDINGASYSYNNLVTAGGLAYFSAYTYETGQHLWRSDGTNAGTFVIDNFNGSYGSSPAELTAVGSVLYFRATVGSGVVNLYRTAGTAAGNVVIKQWITDSSGSFPPINFTAIGSKLYFTGDDPVYDVEPWVSDGTTAGTQLLKDLNTTPDSSNPGGPYSGQSYNSYQYGFANTATVGNTTFFGTNDGALWKTDGTTAGTVKVIDRYNGQPATDVLRHLTAFNGRVYFLTYSYGNYAVWSSDGTTAGTVKLYTGGPYDTRGAGFVPYNGSLYFPSGNELVKTDGTVAGTTVLATGLPYPGEIFAAADGIYFTSGYTAALWRSDGTVAGTAAVPNLPFKNPTGALAVGSTIYLLGTPTSGGNGDQSLYRLDNGVATLLKTGVGDFYGSSNSSLPYLTAFNGKVYFRGFDYEVGGQLWSTDGTPEGTVRLTTTLFTAPQSITVSGDRLYFLAGTETAGLEPWSSDGTPAGTHQVADINPGSASSLTPRMAGWNSQSDWPFFAGPSGTVFVMATDGATGKELWKITPNGAVTRLTDIAPGAADSGARPMSLITPPGATAPLLLMSAADPVYGRELWGISLATTGSISGVVFDDTDADGIRQLSENPLAGETVYLDLNGNAQLDAGEPTAVSTSTGYTFAGVNTGTYTVRLQTPTGGRRTTTPGAAAQVAVTEGNTTIVTTAFGVTSLAGTAIFGGPTSVTEGSAITFDGRGSTEPFGTINKFEWDFNYTGATFDIDATGATPTFDAGQIDGPATRVVGLRVTDANGLVSFVSKAVISITNVAPTARLYNGGPVTLGTATTATFRGLSDPSAADLAAPAYSFDFNNDGDFADAGDIFGASSFSAAFTYAAAGTYTVHGRVADKDGGFSDYYTTVVVAPVPTATSTDPASTLLEGENATFAGGTAKASGNAGYTGTGYADFGGINSSAQWSLTRNGAGPVTLSFRYANGGTTDRPLSITVNGTVVGSVACAATGSWTTWTTVTIAANLVAGANTIKATASASIGGANVDSLTVLSQPTPPPAWLSLGSGASYTLSGNTLIISGGTATLLSDAGATNPGLSIIVNSGAAVVANTTQHLGALGVAGTFTMAAGGGKVLRVTALSQSPSAALNLNDNDLIIDYAAAISGTPPTAELRNWIATARAGGAWNAAGVRSTAAAGNAAFTLGYMDAADYFAINGTAAKFDGETIDATTVLVKYTLAGDANLDGRVDFNDFLRLQNSFNTANAGFAGGDFDYDGKADFNDFLALQNNFGQSLPQRPAPGKAVRR